MRTLHKLMTLWVFTGFCRKILSGKRPSRYSFNHFALLLLVLLSEWKGDGPLHFKGYMQVLCCYDVHDTFRILQLYENQSWINSKNNNYACHKKSMMLLKLIYSACLSFFLQGNSEYRFSSLHSTACTFLLRTIMCVHNIHFDMKKRIEVESIWSRAKSVETN